MPWNSTLPVVLQGEVYLGRPSIPHPKDATALYIQMLQTPSQGPHDSQEAEVGKVTHIADCMLQ